MKFLHFYNHMYFRQFSKDFRHGYDFRDMFDLDLGANNTFSEGKYKKKIIEYVLYFSLNITEAYYWIT